MAVHVLIFHAQRVQVRSAQLNLHNLGNFIESNSTGTTVRVPLLLTHITHRYKQTTPYYKWLGIELSEEPTYKWCPGEGRSVTFFDS